MGDVECVCRNDRDKKQAGENGSRTLAMIVVQGKDVYVKTKLKRGVNGRRGGPTLYDTTKE